MHVKRVRLWSSPNGARGTVRFQRAKNENDSREKENKKKYFVFVMWFFHMYFRYRFWFLWRPRPTSSNGTYMHRCFETEWCVGVYFSSGTVRQINVWNIVCMFGNILMADRNSLAGVCDYVNQMDDNSRKRKINRGQFKKSPEWITNNRLPNGMEAILNERHEYVSSPIDFLFFLLFYVSFSTTVNKRLGNDVSVQ